MILVENVLKTLQELANFHRHYLKIPIIGLTGSNGKTTTKELINAGMENDLDSQLEMEGKYQIEASESADYEEGVNAFLEKRKPEFKGK